MAVKGLKVSFLLLNIKVKIKISEKKPTFESPTLLPSSSKTGTPCNNSLQRITVKKKYLVTVAEKCQLRKNNLIMHKNNDKCTKIMLKAQK